MTIDLKTPCIIIGGGGHAKVVADTLLSLGAQVLGYVDPGKDKGDPLIADIKCLGTDEVIKTYATGEAQLFGGIGSIKDVAPRKNAFETLTAQGYTFPRLIHPSAVVSPHAQIGEGSVIMAGAIIQPATKIGRNVIINTGASIDHDCTLGDHSHVAPGVSLSGNVAVGAESHIGIGANIIQSITIGSGAIIGAGMTIKENIAEGQTVK